MARKSQFQQAIEGELPVALAAIRDRLAMALTKCEPREMAALSKQLVDVIGRLDQIRPEERSEVDEIAERRRARQASISDPAFGDVVGGEGSG